MLNTPGAPAPLVAATRADDRAHGVGRSPAPLFFPRCRARDVRRSTEPDDGQLQGGLGVLRSARRVHRRGSSLTASLASGRRKGTSGTPWNRLSTPCSSPRRLMFLCRRWITNWWRCAGSSMCVFPSRSSKCPRSHLQPVIAGAVCASLSRRQNSWWKCRRSSPIHLCCSGLWSRTSLFQFLVVEGDTLVFKVFLPGRVQQRRLPLRNAFLSGLWSKTWILVCLVAAFKIFRPVQGSSASSSRKGFFALLPHKKCEVGFALGVGTAPRVEPIHSVSSAPCPSQAVGHDLG